MNDKLTAPQFLGDEVLIKKYGKLVVNRLFQYGEEKKEFLHWGGVRSPVIVFPLTEGGQLVLLRQFRNAANRFIFELPGGCPKSEESWEEVLRAELIEETGYRPEKLIRLSNEAWFEPANCITSYIPYLALGCRKEKEPELDSTEVIEVIVLDVSCWINMILSGEVEPDSKSVTVTLLALRTWDSNSVLLRESEFSNVFSKQGRSDRNAPLIWRCSLRKAGKHYILIDIKIQQGKSFIRS